VTDEIVSEFFRSLELNENVGSEAPYILVALVVVEVIVSAAVLIVTEPVA
jgi:hypothetical protein